MKKIFTLSLLFISIMMLSACGETSDKDVIDDKMISEMVLMLSSRQNESGMSIDEFSVMVKDGSYLENSDAVEVYCEVNRTSVDNGDGTFTDSMTYYDYDNDLYELAYESMYNGIDDDDDGEIDEDDEILMFVTDEMTDGIDNNHNGIVDEYFEMTPTHVISYVTTYDEGSVETTVDENGVETTVGSFFYTWTETRTPYNGQIIEYGACYNAEEEMTE